MGTLTGLALCIKTYRKAALPSLTGLALCIKTYRKAALARSNLSLMGLALCIKTYRKAALARSNLCADHLRNFQHKLSIITTRDSVRCRSGCFLHVLTLARNCAVCSSAQWGKIAR